MRYSFDRTQMPFLGVALEEHLPVLSDALTDSLGTRPPRGAPQDGPSTYWLDRAITALRERLVSGSPEPFASGNVTYLQLQGTNVEARYDYDPVDSDVADAVPAAEFLTMLEEWRAQVLELSPEADRRNPPPRPAWPMPPST